MVVYVTALSLQEELDQLKAAAIQADANLAAATEAASQQARQQLREAQVTAAAAAKLHQQRAAQLNQRCSQLAEQAGQLEEALQQQVLAAQQTAASRQQQILVSGPNLRYCVSGGSVTQPSPSPDDKACLAGSTKHLQAYDLTNNPLQVCVVVHVPAPAPFQQKGP